MFIREMEKCRVQETDGGAFGGSKKSLCYRATIIQEGMNEMWPKPDKKLDIYISNIEIVLFEF